MALRSLSSCRRRARSRQFARLNRASVLAALLLSSAVSTIGLSSSPLYPVIKQPRALDFEKRVAAQQAVEEVY